MPILAELAFACHELLGWSDQEALELLAGLSSTPTQPAHRLAQLAHLAAERPGVSRPVGRCRPRHRHSDSRSRPGIRGGI